MAVVLSYLLTDRCKYGEYLYTPILDGGDFHGMTGEPYGKIVEIQENL